MTSAVFNYHGKNYMINPALAWAPGPEAPAHEPFRELWIKIQIAWGTAHGLSREEIIRRIDRGLAPTNII